MQTIFNYLPIGNNLPASLWWFMVIWAFAMGSCFGSFLNVLVYRMPRGKSIMKPGSYCPECKHPIRAIHNLPIFAWLLLRGRCYDCGVKFSVRYPLVEFTVAIVTAMLMIRGPLHIEMGIDGLTASQIAAVWTEFVITVITFFVLFGAALIHFDHLAVPKTIMIPACLFVVGLRLLIGLNYHQGLFQQSHLPYSGIDFTIKTLSWGTQFQFDLLISIGIIAVIYVWRKSSSDARPTKSNVSWMILFASLAISWIAMLPCLIIGIAGAAAVHFLSQQNSSEKSTFGLWFVTTLIMILY